MARSKKTSDLDPPLHLADFEKQLQELSQLVNQLENGDLSLESALQAFERGMVLVNTCQQTLQQAEQKVHVLMEQQGKQTLAPFKEQDEDLA